MPKRTKKARTWPKLTAEQVVYAIKRKYAIHKHSGNKPPQWVGFDEFRIGTGYKRSRSRISPEQRIDLFMMNCYPSNLFERHAFEVKIDRGDWTGELKDPYKRMAAYRLCNRFYFAVPKGMVDKNEVPDGCGLVEVSIAGHEGQPSVNMQTEASVVLQAPFHESDAPTWMLVAAIARRACR